MLPAEDGPTQQAALRSPLYLKLEALARAHALPDSLEHILFIRHPDAIHAWGHANLVRRHPSLQDKMNNEAFADHLRSTGRYITSEQSQLHDIIVDEHARVAVVRMSYFLQVKGGDGEVVENELVWWLRFSNGDVEHVKIIESIEYIDASASARIGTLVRRVYGTIGDDVRGGITLQE